MGQDAGQQAQVGLSGKGQLRLQRLQRALMRTPQQNMGVSCTASQSSLMPAFLIRSFQRVNSLRTMAANFGCDSTSILYP